MFISYNTDIKNIYHYVFYLYVYHSRHLTQEYFDYTERKYFRESYGQLLKIHDCFWIRVSSRSRLIANMLQSRIISNLQYAKIGDHGDHRTMSGVSNAPLPRIWRPLLHSIQLASNIAPRVAKFGGSAVYSSPVSYTCRSIGKYCQMIQYEINRHKN